MFKNQSCIKLHLEKKGSKQQTKILFYISLLQFALCLMAVLAVVAAKPDIVAPLAYTSPAVVASPYTAAYTAAYASPYYSAYASPYVAAAPYTAAYSAYPYAASYYLRK